MLRKHSENSAFNNIFMPIVSVIVISLLLACATRVEKKHQEAAEHLQELAYNEYIEMKMLEEKDSFYQKLADGFDVNILVAGDSIGANSGVSNAGARWTTLLQKHLRSEYSVSGRITNVSIGGGTAYTDYVRVKNLQKNKEYDLAIICCGQNDKLKDFGVRYEALIRAIRNQNEKCSIIAILESSQKSYTEKMNIIKELSAHYGIEVADTIAPFTDGSNGDYSTLTTDGVHPNDKGYTIYAQTIQKIIDESVKQYKGYDFTEIPTVYEGVNDFDNFQYIGAKDFIRNENTFTYDLDSAISGICGIDYAFVSGQNSCKIFIDGVEFAAPESYFDYDFTQRKIMVLSTDYITAKSTIEVSFTEEEQANSFNGICFSWK